METARARVPTAKYTKMGETLRHVIPGHMQCSMACGGRACKYENPSRWSDEEQAVKGLYSSWITDNLLAMARPSTEIIEKYSIIEQFRRCGLKTIINLQRPGEHASCGNPLEQESGFTYRPETFMEADIYYYNFGWKDYGVASLMTILDMVKVMSFAVQEGKLAVHCHAGLGRTGVLLACYLVFTSWMSADKAILFVRAKRPNSIQTRGQLLCVREFAQFLVPLRSIFSCAEPKASAVTLSQYLARQRHLLHGYEARRMKNVPKIVQLVCRLLIDIAANRQAAMEEEWVEVPDLTAEVEKTVSQQAIQQLGKEMRGKGIPTRSCSPRPLSPNGLQPKPLHDQLLISDNELDPLWRRQNLESPLRCSLSCSRGFSYSDSHLHKLGPPRYLLENPRPMGRHGHHSLSHGSLATSDLLRVAHCPPLGGASRLPDSSSEARQETRATFLRNHTLEGRQRSSSDDDVSEQGRRSRCDGSRALRRLDALLVATTEVPFITLETELSSESRRLHVAKALAMELVDQELVGQELHSKVSLWQMELNSREGAWERLSRERDPLVLSSLMWSWLEQLKDPVISSEDIKALSEKSVSAQSSLDSLEKGHRLTLLCILDCAAHLLPMPKEVETNFLNQTIKVFTKIDAPSVRNESLYATLKAILSPILHELFLRATQEAADS